MCNENLQEGRAPAEFAAFRDYIQQHSGIYLEDSQAGSLRASVASRATQLRLADCRDYFAVLTSDADEFDELINLVTINETSFFRFAEQFAALRDIVGPELVRVGHARGSTALKVWSAGCSTGEEVYTIAMTLLDSPAIASDKRFEVLGTDVSTDALDRARMATYPAKSLANLTDEVRGRWFEAVGDGWRPTAEVRRRCDFRYHNLTREPFPDDLAQGWDLIFCRNVTIYFRAETTRRIADHLFEALNPGGYLFLGHSETLTSLSTRFETIEAGGVYLYRKPLDEVAATRIETLPALHARRVIPAGGARPSTPNIAGVSSHRQATRTAPAAVVDAASTGGEAADGGRPKPQGANSADLARRAHRLLEDARPADALRLATDVLAVSPNDTEAQLVVAFAHADLGDLSEAAAEARVILARDPLVAPASYLLGAIHREQGRTGEAVAQFRRTLQSDPDFVLAHFALAGIHQQLEEYGNAAREYENALQALRRRPEGDWTAFLGGFRPDLLAQTCERGLAECRRVSPAKGTRAIRR